MRPRLPHSRPLGKVELCVKTFSECVIVIVIWCSARSQLAWRPAAAPCVSPSVLGFSVDGDASLFSGVCCAFSCTCSVARGCLRRHDPGLHVQCTLACPRLRWKIMSILSRILSTRSTPLCVLSGRGDLTLSASPAWALDARFPRCQTVCIAPRRGARLFLPWR